jgi:hypothetical protein
MKLHHFCPFIELVQSFIKFEVTLHKKVERRGHGETLILAQVVPHNACEFAKKVTKLHCNPTSRTREHPNEHHNTDP